LANGINIDAVNHKKESALHILIRSYIFCVNKGSSLLHLIHPIIEIINLIVENGIDQTIRNFEGKTALQYLNGDNNHMNLLKKMMSMDTCVLVIYESNTVMCDPLIHL
jgi:hypothetical protein